MLQAALESEVQEFLEQHSSRVDEQGRRQVVRNGYLPSREIVTGAGPLEVSQPRVRDKSADATQRVRFSSSILPPYLRKSKSIEELIPWLYLKGISTGDFSEALQSLVGPDASGFSAKVAAVAADLSPAYGLAIRQNLSGAALVFDRFHLVKLLNEHLTELRRQLQREAEMQLQKSVLKGTRWLLLKHPEDLDDDRDEHQRLQKALERNQSLAAAYYLKEDRQIWEQPIKEIGAIVLDRWIRQAEATGIRELHKFAKTLRTHRNGILAWYDHQISTGPLEGTNNKIKLLQRQAYGYRDLKFFKLKLLALHRTQHAFTG